MSVNSSVFYSVITPTKNSGSLIERTLKSVACQTHGSFEHIVIDSNSTDQTVRILKKYQNRYPEYLLNFISESDSGISEAFNKGIERSSGEWIIFLGAGDELVDCNILNVMEKELRQREGKLIVWGDIAYKNIEGDVGKAEKNSFSKGRLKRYMCIPHQATFTNKATYSEYGLYDEKYKVTMDYDFCLRFINLLTKDLYVKKTVSYMLTGGVSSNSEKVLRESMNSQKLNKAWRVSFIPRFFFIWGYIKFFIKKAISKYQCF